MTRSRRHRPKIRVIALAAVCCVALFALSAPAFAVPAGMPVNAPTLDQVRQGPSVKPAEKPAVLSAATTDSPSYRSDATAPSGITGGAATTDAPSYRGGDTVNRVHPSPASPVITPELQPSVVHDNGDQTLPIVLAGSALGIALAGAGFGLLRTRQPRAAGLH
jgi:hypothetical protein